MKMYRFCIYISIYFFVTASMVSEASSCKEILSTLHFTNKKTPAINQLSISDRFAELDILLKNSVHQYKPESYIKYAGREGQILFAMEKFNGDMRKAYDYVKNRFIHDPTWKAKIGWREFNGTVKDFYQLKNELMLEITESDKHRQHLFDSARDRMLFIFHQAKYIKEKYIGIKGQAHLAMDRYEGYMQKAYVNGVAVLGERVIKEIKWEEGFNGALLDFKSIWTLLEDAYGNVNMKYISNDGLRAFAQEYYNGDVRRAYVNALVVLTDLQFNQLHWYKYAIYHPGHIQLHQIHKRKF